MATPLQPLDRMQSAIQLAAFHYIVCLKATPSNKDHTLATKDMEYYFENIRTADSRILHFEFQRWATGAVLRDLVEHFSIFLSDTYHTAVSNSLNRTFVVSPKQFQRRGIEGQLAILAAEFTVAPEWVSRLSGFNRARNCLAHRAGIVGGPDTTDGQEMVVRWLMPKTTITDDPPDQRIDVSGPMGTLVQAQHIDGDFATKVELQDREKRVRIGDDLHFNPDEIFEICQTFQLAAAAFSEMGPPNGLPSDDFTALNN
ncbi:hypothetical protein C8J35_12318 [Rhizobium sp. PP-F2F-G38]|uniref:hypothetical protein n=1 Tax=Rhizobium sp. PP-CC-3G-465 TaxID=2135648 RepID=UPI000D98F0F3|nr:hypothetical protein C8J37_12325 [Rhizobium sp. PP-WC-1G-195]PYE92523.1 hypothetical protein C8J35_12318 [Rhizobium sp. PP-F2F-G38]TCQ14333.1 hypothetical protein C8J33_12612 [Rhizobium sp. PP-CC-3G-465]